MNLSRIKSGDIVKLNLSGRTVFGEVVEPKATTPVGRRLTFEPINHNCSYRHAESTEVEAAYRKIGRRR